MSAEFIVLIFLCLLMAVILAYHIDKTNIRVRNLEEEFKIFIQRKEEKK